MSYAINKIRFVIFSLLMLFICSCVTTKAKIDRTAQNMIFWPGPPETPRISYEYSISYLGSSNSFVSLFAGAKEDIINPKYSESLLRPYSLYVYNNKIFITDIGAMRLSIVDVSSGDSYSITKVGKMELLSPVGVVVYKNRIYLSDSLLSNVFILTMKGKLIAKFKGRLKRPTCLAVDKKNERIYLSDTLAHKVYVYDPNGNRLGSIGKRGNRDGEFNFPTHLWVDERSNLYVTDTMNFRIQVFSPDGKFRFKIGKLGKAYGHLEKPKGVATDSDGNIYVVDSINDTVKIFNRKGKLLLFFGEKGTYYGDFWLPSGIFIAKDYIYVADTYNSRVQVFKYLGSGEKVKH